MRVSIRLRRDEGLKIKAEIDGDRTLELNATKEMGHCFTPIELFLFSLGGCTAMDVIWILERQRQKMDNFGVCAQGTRRQDDPKYYEAIA